jgi:small subunit ribosomal protein S9
MRVSLHSSSLREVLRCIYSPPSTSLHVPLRRQILSAPTKQFTTSSRRHAGIAAPEINFKTSGQALEGNDAGNSEKQVFARLVPVSRSYFTAQPGFMDDLLMLQNLAGKYSHLPTLKPDELPRVAWVPIAEYRNISGENVKASRYAKIIEVLTRLNRIHPAMMPNVVREAIGVYKRDINPFQNKAKERTVDKYGRGLGAGRRKTSTARAWLVEGTGEVLVNGKTLAEAFARVHDRETVIWALKATDRLDKYNVWARAEGGGTTGQAEALALAVGKALLVHEPALKPAVRRCESSEPVPFRTLLMMHTAGCVTRDPRRVERKKPGHVKARKMPAWVKR